ncbi:putative GNAT family acetyltransferase [Bosea sp. OAE506]|uniref:GNAT family N-acetyltransferase n=1 Tax=Bosea sp. OAE506 TaxID=2663870 RepID=UPI00178976B0
MPAQERQTGIVIENAAAGRFEMSFPGGTAFASFRRDGDRLIITHTEVPAAHEGRGIGSQLVRGLFESARDSGRRIVPACSFVATWARRHPEFAEVLAH